MSDDFDLDRSTAAAWTAFGSALAAHLAGMTDPDTLVLEVLVGDEPEDGAAPYVQFAGFGGDHLRAEVSSNAYLAPQHALDADAERRLRALGWQGPDDNWYADSPTAEHDALAGLVVRTLRDVLEVAHPAFLTTPSADHGESLGLMAPGETMLGSTEDDEPLAVVPTDRAHLVALVDRALTPLFGTAPLHDEDGDIPVPHNSTLVFVRVREDDPVVELFSFVVRGVTDVEAARLEVGLLNRDLKFVKFITAEDWIMAQLQLPALPFVPSTLRSMLTYMSTTLDEVDDDLALRTGGRRALDNESDDAAVVSAPNRVSGVKALYREFWSLVAPEAHARGWTTSGPPPRHWWRMPASGSGTSWSVSYSRFGCRVELYLDHPDPEVNLHRLRELEARAPAIASVLGEPLLLDPLPHATACRAELRLLGPKIADRDQWPGVAAWMVDRMARLREAIERTGGVPTSLPG